MDYTNSSVSTVSNLTTIAPLADPVADSRPAIRSQLEYHVGQDTEAMSSGGGRIDGFGSQPAGGEIDLEISQPSASALYPDPRAFSVNPPPSTLGRDFVGGSGFGQPSSDTYGGMSGGQMVMGSAMGPDGAQFGGGGFGDFVGGGFGQPQPDRPGLGSQPAGGGFGSGQPQQFGSQPAVCDIVVGSQPDAVPPSPPREDEAVVPVTVPPPLPPAGRLSTCACSRVCRCAYFAQAHLVWICFEYQTQFYMN